MTAPPLRTPPPKTPPVAEEGTEDKELELHKLDLKRRRASFALSLPWSPDKSLFKTPPPTPPEGSNEQLTHVRVVFDLFDVDASGEISATELYSLFHALGDDVPKQEIENVLQEYDRDGSGGLEYEAFQNPKRLLFKCHLDLIATTIW